jgi:hypothetical protein
MSWRPLGAAAAKVAAATNASVITILDGDWSKYRCTDGQSAHFRSWSGGLI